MLYFRQYVLGFAFDIILNRVLLIQKTKPKWQAGLLNGVGGKIEPNESAIDAMVREFKEETNVDTLAREWQNFGKHLRPARAANDYDSYSLHMFNTELNNDQINQVSQTTEEEPKWFYLKDLGQLLEQGVSGSALYVAMAQNHLRTFFNTTTIET